MAEDRLNEIKKLEERIKLEKEAIKTPEQTIEACITKAHKYADKIRASRLAKLEDLNYEKVAKAAKGLDDAVSDAKCKVDCITVSADAKKCATAFDDFAEDLKKELGELKDKKYQASLKLDRLAHAVVKAKNLDMNKVNAHVHAILAEVGFKADVDRNEIQKNLTNLVQKGKTDQKLMILVDWNKAGLSKDMKIRDLTVSDLQKLIVNMKGGKD